MKPLVYWCRWNEARIKLAGRDPNAIWGHLDFWKKEELVRFRYQLNERELTLETDPQPRKIMLDEMGVEDKSTGPIS